MKKVLSLLGMGLIAATSTLTLVSCAERPIPSIASPDNAYKIGDKDRYDVSKWNNDVMNASKYKDYVLNNFKDAVMQNKELNWTKFATEMPVDESAKPESKDGETVTIMDQLIKEYVDGSNVLSKDIEMKDIIDGLDYKLFDASEKELVKVYDSTSEATFDEAKLKVTKHKDTGVYVLHFKVGIEATNDSLFMGKRLNFVEKGANAEQGQITSKDVIKYYEDQKAITKDGDKYKLADKDHASALPLMLNDGKVTVNSFDYMFDILFNFSIN